MMKETELMIGDWVRLEYKNPNTGDLIRKDFQVDQIVRPWRDEPHDVWSKENGNMGQVAYMMPIPLTAYILEKNGFEYRHAGEPIKRQYWILRYDGGNVKAKINRGLLYFEITGVPAKEGYFAPCFQGHIEYVHELQHSLRGCRLKGLADNFIV